MESHTNESSFICYRIKFHVIKINDFVFFFFFLFLCQYNSRTFFTFISTRYCITNAIKQHFFLCIRLIILKKKKSIRMNIFVISCAYINYYFNLILYNFNPRYSVCYLCYLIIIIITFYILTDGN